MTVVKRCPSLEDAYLTQNLLEAAGIESHLLDETSASLAPMFFLESGIRLTVADEDAAEAREVLGLPPLEVAPEARKPYGLRWFAGAVAGVAIVSLVSYARSQSGTVRTESEDRNHNGIIERKITRRDDGTMVFSLEDRDEDSRWDKRSEFLIDGKPEKISLDEDRDGVFETVQTYENGKLASELITPPPQSTPSIRNVYRDGLLESRWEDLDRDGGWDLRIDFDPSGKESSRTPLK